MPFTLLHPGLFAFGLACVSIPIILHLLRRKRRPIPWGAMGFLEQAYRKRRRILTIEQLILLALRCLLLALIAMGVGSLMLGSGMGQSIPTTMVIVIDQSIGSALIDGEMSALDMNKRFALRALDELDALRGDQVMLIGAGMPAGGLVMPESTDIGAVKALIEQLEATDSGFDLDGALGLVGNMTSDPDRAVKKVLVIAASGRGFDRAMSESSGVEAFDRVIVRSPATDQVSNVGIERAAPTRSLVMHSGISLPMGVRVGLVRSGPTGQAQSTIEVLDQLGSVIGRRVVGWDEGQRERSAVIAIEAQTIQAMGARTAMVKVRIDDDANVRDNTRRVALATRTAIRVGVIDQGSAIGSERSAGIGASRWVRAALAPDDRFGITIIDIDAARASAMLTASLDAVVVLAPGAIDDSAWDRIGQLHQSGMLVVIAPDARGASLGWLDRVEKLSAGMLKGGTVLREHNPTIGLAPEQTIPDSSVLIGIGSEFDQLARAVSVSRSVRFVLGETGEATVLFDDGSALAVQADGGGSDGLVVVFATGFDLEWTDLVARPMFVPMMQEIVRQGVGIGSSVPAIMAGDRMASPAWVVTNQRIFIEGGARLATTLDDTARAGVIAQLDAQGATRSFVVINPDAHGARTDPGSIEELEDAILARVDVNGINGIDWIDWIESGDQSGDVQQEGTTMLASSAPGVSIALWVLTAAGFIAVIEFVLARLFTTKLFEAQTQGARV